MNKYFKKVNKILLNIDLSIYYGTAVLTFSKFDQKND